MKFVSQFRVTSTWMGSACLDCVVGNVNSLPGGKLGEGAFGAVQPYMIWVGCAGIHGNLESGNQLALSHW